MKPNIWHTRRTNVERPELLSSMISMIILNVENNAVDDHDKKWRWSCWWKARTLGGFYSISELLLLALRGLPTNRCRPVTNHRRRNAKKRHILLNPEPFSGNTILNFFYTYDSDILEKKWVIPHISSADSISEFACLKILTFWDSSDFIHFGNIELATFIHFGNKSVPAMELIDWLLPKKEWLNGTAYTLKTDKRASGGSRKR